MRLVAVLGARNSVGQEGASMSVLSVKWLNSQLSVGMVSCWQYSVDINSVHTSHFCTAKH